MLRNFVFIQSLFLLAVLSLPSFAGDYSKFKRQPNSIFKCRVVVSNFLSGLKGLVRTDTSMARKVRRGKPPVAPYGWEISEKIVMDSMFRGHAYHSIVPRLIPDAYQETDALIPWAIGFYQKHGVFPPGSKEALDEPLNSAVKAGGGNPLFGSGGFNDRRGIEGYANAFGRKGPAKEATPHRSAPYVFKDLTWEVPGSTRIFDAGSGVGNVWREYHRGAEYHGFRPDEVPFVTTLTADPLNGFHPSGKYADRSKSIKGKLFDDLTNEEIGLNQDVILDVNGVFAYHPNPAYVLRRFRELSHEGGQMLIAYGGEPQVKSSLDAEPVALDIYLKDILGDDLKIGEGFVNGANEGEKIPTTFLHITIGKSSWELPDLQFLKFDDSIDDDTSRKTMIILP